MNASLFYYKGYDLRNEHPAIGKWFDAMESREVYRGTQSDFHTHAHDLPPQMGGCFFPYGGQRINETKLVDHGPYQNITGEVNPEVYPMPQLAKEEAAYRMIKHHETLASKSPFGEEAFDDGVRCALTLLLTGQQIAPATKDADHAIRYIRDRISVPRDMSIWAAKNLRQSLEDTAQLISTDPEGRYSIPISNRKDQDPSPFVGNIERKEEEPKNGFSFSGLWGMLVGA